MSKIEIQKITGENHIKTVKILAQEIWSEHFTPIIGAAQVDYMLQKFQSETAISEQINKGFHYYLIGNMPEYIGYMGVKEGKHTLFLSKLYIKSAYRGRGYGKQITQFLQLLAEQNGLKTITLTVNKDNSDTIKAYKKLGFKIISSVVKDIGEDFVMDDYVMEKGVFDKP